jgi:hypothetical protein
LIVLTGAVGIQQIESIIGIISVSLSVLWILFKFALKVYQAIKNKDYFNLENDINKTKEDLDKIKEDLESRRENGRQDTE